MNSSTSSPELSLAKPYTSINSTIHTTLELPPSCVEFTPKLISPTWLRHCFIVGTYHLESSAFGTDDDDDDEEEKTQKRSGGLLVFHLQGQILSLLCSKSTPYAVLDLHFSEFENGIFAVATSAGLLCVFALEVGNDQSVSMRNISSHQIADPSNLALSMAWSISSCNPSTIAVSLSNGQIAMFDYKVPDGSVRYIQAHTLEAWTVAWSATSDTGGHPSLYSGGDDSAVCEHGERYLPLSTQKADELSTGGGWEKISCDTKTHSAGVTAILVLSLDNVTDGEIILTGSYDECIRVIVSAAAGRRAKVLAEKQLGGGVWRLKLLESSLSKFGEKKIVLASCMHAGPKVVEIIRSSEDIWAIDIMATFEEHKSMNYASDARKEESKNGVNSMTCVSTSFYDKKLCVWNIEKSLAN